MCRRYNPSVSFTNISTARVRHNDGDIAIDIGADVVDQTVTSMPRQIWTLIAQEGLITHEIGHVLYTDFEAHERIQDELGMSEASAFHNIVWNPAEDAAIEEQLRWKFNCGQELDTYNANLFERQKDGCQHMKVPQAVKVAILEKGCYDAGAVDEHLAGKRQMVAPGDDDLFRELLDEVNDMLAAVMTEPDPGARYDRMLEFWNLLKDKMQEEGQDATNEAQDGQGEGYDDTKPDDTSGMTEGQEADALEDLDEQEVQEQLQQSMMPDDLDFDEDGEEAEDGDGAGAGEDGEEADEDAEGGEGASESEEGEDEQSPSGEGGSGEAGGEDAENEEEGEGDDAGDGDGESESDYPGHEGHRLVIKD